MSEKIVQLNEEIIKGQLKELVRGSVEETLNELPLDNFLIQLYNFLRHSLLAPFECLCGNFILPEPASYVFFICFFQFAQLIGPVDKSKNSAETHSGSSRTVNLGIAKDGIYHPLEV